MDTHLIVMIVEIVLAVVVAVGLIAAIVLWLRKGSTSVPPRVEAPVEPSSDDGGSSAAEGAAPPRDEVGGAAPGVPAVAGPVGEEAAVEETAVVEDTTVVVEAPESVPSRLARLRGRLARSGALGAALLNVLSRSDLSAADWEEIEDTLLMADLGLAATDELMEALRTRVKVEGSEDREFVRRALTEELLALVGPDMDRSLNLDRPVDAEGVEGPAAVLVVGVNGVGKTTTIGKLARLLVAEGRSVVLGAADTFRAAAADQLETWGERAGVEVVRSDREGADPASVAFDAVRRGVEAGADVVVVDTAGRLQSKADLMDELGKVKRVMERRGPVGEVLLVLDATMGQNGFRQAEAFAEVAGVTGIVLTKLDGSAKGGIVVSVQRELGVPVKLVGLGEGPDDLAPFDPRSFVEAVVGG